MSAVAGGLALAAGVVGFVVIRPVHSWLSHIIEDWLKTQGTRVLGTVLMWTALSVLPVELSKSRIRQEINDVGIPDIIELERELKTPELVILLKILKVSFGTSRGILRQQWSWRSGPGLAWRRVAAGIFGLTGILEAVLEVLAKLHLAGVNAPYEHASSAALMITPFALIGVFLLLGKYALCSAAIWLMPLDAEIDTAVYCPYMSHNTRWVWLTAGGLGVTGLVLRALVRQRRAIAGLPLTLLFGGFCFVICARPFFDGQGDGITLMLEVALAIAVARSTVAAIRQLAPRAVPPVLPQV